MTISYSALENQPVSLRSRWTDFSQKVTDSLEIKKQRGHLLVLDGVRAVACLAVVLHHIIYHIVLPLHWSGLWVPSGKLQVLLASVLSFGATGVFLFFLLSSFLLFLPFAKMLLLDGPRPGLVSFYIRRVFRIVPGYFVAIILMVLFFHPEFVHAANRWKLLQFFTFTMQASVPEQLNGPFWTMAVEFQFYLLLPLIVGLFSLVVPRGTLHWRMTKLFGCLILLLGWGALSRWWGLTLPASATGFPQNFLVALRPYYYGDGGKYFESFTIGMLLAMLYVYTHHTPNGDLLRLKLQRWSGLMFLIGGMIVALLSVYIFCVSNSNYSDIVPIVNTYRETLVPMYAQWQSTLYSIGYGLCVCALLYNAGWLKRPFEGSVLRWIGLISFSLYMWHLPFLFLFMHMMQQFHGVGRGIEFVALICWVIFVIFPISLTLYRWIEMPGMRLGEWFVQRVTRVKKTKPVDVAIEETQRMPVAAKTF